MFWGNGKSMRAFVAGAMAVSAVAIAGTASAQSVVVRSTGPSASTYPQGKKLPANTSVVLKAGDHV
ncbi:MAG: hypothetical protein RLZZ84_2316, partial [Pseudomonadota bacterium]